MKGITQVKNLIHVCIVTKDLLKVVNWRAMKLHTQDKKPYSYLHCDKTIAGKDIIHKHGRTLMEELLQVKTLMYVLFVTKNLLTNNTWRFMKRFTKMKYLIHVWIVTKHLHKMHIWSSTKGLTHVKNLMYVFLWQTFAQSNEMNIHEKNHTGENLMRVLFVTKCLRKFRGTKIFFMNKRWFWYCHFMTTNIFFC